MSERVDLAGLVALSDGRTLGYAEWGDPDGRPLIGLHGTPGCRLNRLPNEDMLRETRTRLVTYDRPGYGVSSRLPGRRVVDCVDDIQALADHLGLDRFAVLGISGGGPHSLAAAALLPDRVTRAMSQVGPAPRAALGEEWSTGMDPENVKEFGWALEGEQRLREELTLQDAQMRRRVEHDPLDVLGDFQLTETDREVLERDDMQQLIRESTAEATLNGVWGWVDDDLAFIWDWGFDPATITVPTAVWWNGQDVLSPPQHGEWLAATIPTTVPRRTVDTGHLGGDLDVETRLAIGWLLDGRPWV